MRSLALSPLIEIRKRMSGSERVRGPATAPHVGKAIWKERRFRSEEDVTSVSLELIWTDILHSCH